MRRGPKPAKSKEAKSPVARKSPKNDATRVRDLEKQLAEALQRETEGLQREAEAQAQQMATAEILRVISSSPSDLQPVFDAIVRSVVRLCNGVFGTVFLYDGQVVTLAAVQNAPPEAVEALRRIFPTSPHPTMVAGRALLSRGTVHIHDALSDAQLSLGMVAVARAWGFRTVIAVPMLRDGQPIGALSVARPEVQPFSEAEIALLQTFADQAVIAIENVRLFNATKEALDRQTATAEILRVIANSPTELQP